MQKRFCLAIIALCLCTTGQTETADNESTLEPEHSNQTESEPEVSTEPEIEPTKTKILEKQHEILDPEGNVQVYWEVDNEEQIVIFEVVAKTKGYVGFGLNFNGGMQGADMIIGGVFPNGEIYFDDFFGVGNTMPIRDVEQNWILLQASENETHTMVKFSRAFDTCDQFDVPITNDTINMIWALGEQDVRNYHFAVRGTLPVNLLDPAYPTLDMSEYSLYDMANNMAMPPKRFSYWCKIFRAPNFQGKVHVVGFKPLLDGPLAFRHIHHFVLYKCSAPDGEDDEAVFEPFVSTDGEDCYVAPSLKRQPTGLCKVSLYIWGAGGKPLFLPEHVGYPAGLNDKEYFMLETHYDNPEISSNVRFRAGVQVVYSKRLRENEGALITIGHATLLSIFIPPLTRNWQIKGHCCANCTNRWIPKEGIRVFNAMLHSHLAGRKMRLRHFRGTSELSFIANDDHYHFNYQKNRPIRDERLVLPGDHISFECTYDTLDRTNVTIGGFSTVHEMCETFVWYYPAQNVKSCSSLIPPELLFQKFGITGTKWSEGFEANDPLLTAPESVANKTFTEFANTMIQWNDPLIQDLSNMLRSAPQIASCDLFPSKDDTELKNGTDATLEDDDEESNTELTTDSELLNGTDATLEDDEEESNTELTTDSELLNGTEVTLIEESSVELTTGSDNGNLSSDQQNPKEPSSQPGIILTNTPIVQKVYYPPSTCPPRTLNVLPQFLGIDNTQQTFVKHPENLDPPVPENSFSTLLPDADLSTSTVSNNETEEEQEPDSKENEIPNSGEKNGLSVQLILLLALKYFL